MTPANPLGGGGAYDPEFDPDRVGEPPPVQHAYLETTALRHETKGLPHDTRVDLQSAHCWCGPDLLTPCPHCDAEPGGGIMDVRTGEVLDEAPADPGREPWEAPCEACGGSGLMPVELDDPELGSYYTVIVCHRDV